MLRETQNREVPHSLPFRLPIILLKYCFLPQNISFLSNPVESISSFHTHVPTLFSLCFTVSYVDSTHITKNVNLPCVHKRFIHGTLTWKNNTVYSSCRGKKREKKATICLWLLLKKSPWGSPLNLGTFLGLRSHDLLEQLQGFLRVVHLHICISSSQNRQQNKIKKNVQIYIYIKKNIYIYIPVIHMTSTLWELSLFSIEG